MSSPTATPSPSGSPSPTTSPTYQEPTNPWKGGSTAAKAAGEPPPLSRADLDAQIAQADALLAELSAGNAELAALLKQLDELTEKANAALEAKAAADQALRDATTLAETSRATADALAEQLREKHQQLRDWAFSAYSEGGSTAEIMHIFDALMKDPANAGNPVGDLTYLTDERARLFQDIRHLAKRQEEVAARAEANVDAAEVAAQNAAEATAEAEQAVKAHEDAVTKAQADQTDLLQNAGPLAAMLLGVSSPEARQRGQAILDALIERNIDLPDLDKPCSNDNGIYPNGQLPASALCPLWMAPGEYAIPRAAAAFNALSKKFTEDFGRPICVTDSYRSFAQQVAVKASRGFWAATPGYSNHGLGRALDLCGGINSFGTIEHRWMRQNAPAYGWFHPSWAAADGRKPEPWHWEFAG
ncbi:MAG TPA: hypothetical protein GXZ60_09300 [Intrasporangiaceae bacterium]|nr:hypothetical protein [Intrasporangiaceae bacterium]